MSTDQHLPLLTLSYSPPFLINYHLFFAPCHHPHGFIITGDFNIHVDVSLAPQSIHYLDLLNCTNHTPQYVHFSTHKHDHTLEILIICGNTTLNPSITSSVFDISYHYPILITLCHSYSSPSSTTFIYHPLNKIDYHRFIHDLNSTPLIANFSSTFTDLHESYVTTFAPLNTKTNNS